MRHVRRILVVALSGFGLISVAQAQDSMPASTTRIGITINAIAGYVSATEQLKEAALRHGSAIKASCIEEKGRQLRGLLDTSKNIQLSWSTASQNPAYAQRTMDRVNVLELSANSLYDEARACTDARDLKFELEIIVPPDLPEAPPTWSAQTPPTFERPPLASPY